MADPTEEEAAAFDEEATWRRELERLGRIAADTIIDLQDRGPLYQYVAERMEVAVKAMSSLARIDPTDAAGIAVLQAQIAGWLDACEWIHARLEAGKQAETTINEEFEANGEEEPQD